MKCKVYFYVFFICSIERITNTDSNFYGLVGFVEILKAAFSIRLYVQVGSLFCACLLKKSKLIHYSISFVFSEILGDKWFAPFITLNINSLATYIGKFNAFVWNVTLFMQYCVHLNSVVYKIIRKCLLFKISIFVVK